jgi:uncharacterized membrane protein
MEKGYRKYSIVMLLCFLFGGFSLILYMLLFYSTFWQNEMVMGIRREGEVFPTPIFSRELIEHNISNITNASIQPPRSFVISNPSSLLLSPFSITFLAAGILSIVAGLSIWNLIREREIRSTKKMLLDVFLLPDEKKVLGEIEKYGGSLTQSELVKTTGLSRVKIHRIVRNLESKKLIIKQQYGMTNKIVLKK